MASCALITKSKINKVIDNLLQKLSISLGFSQLVPIFTKRVWRHHFLNNPISQGCPEYIHYFLFQPIPMQQQNYILMILYYLESGNGCLHTFKTKIHLFPSLTKCLYSIGKAFSLFTIRGLAAQLANDACKSFRPLEL